MSVEELLSSILGVLRSFRKPAKIICGYTEGINTTGKRLTEKPTPIKRVVVVKVRDLGTGSYIALGSEDIEVPPFRLNNTDDTLDIDFVDDLKKVVVITDAGGTGVLEWIGG
ncbi:MAG: hypothetical protein PHH85_01950 [Candidatus Methanoperedens sp.]|nr:hypothetical protein [Candidatus Methanoperedens sp.]